MTTLFNDGSMLLQPSPPPQPTHNEVRLGKTISFRGFPYPVKLEILPSPPFSVFGTREYLKGTIVINERDGNLPPGLGDLNVTACLPDGYDDETLARAMRFVIKELFSHEVDECIYVGGVRVFDPHHQPRQL